MWPVSALWAPSLGQSHGVVTRVEAWLGGAKVADVPFGDCTITGTARNRVRRTCSVSVAEALYPDAAGAALTPFGGELRVYSGIDYGATTELVPVFRGRIDDADGGDRYAGKVQISASDGGATLNDTRFETTRAAPTGYATTAAIVQLIAEVFPDRGVAVTVPADGTVPAGLSWDKDRGQAIDDLAKALGADVWQDPDGSWHITGPPDLASTAAWTLADGVGGCVVRDQRKVSRAGVYNVVIALSSASTGTTPIRVMVSDDDPTSPTWVGGPFGRVPRFYTSPLLSTPAQATQAALALLQRSVGLTRTRSVTCVPNPALEIGDRIDLLVAGQTERHLVDSFVLPSKPGDPMQITTRSLKPDAGDIDDTTGG